MGLNDEKVKAILGQEAWNILCEWAAGCPEDEGDGTEASPIGWWKSPAEDRALWKKSPRLARDAGGAERLVSAGTL